MLADISEATYAWHSIIISMRSMRIVKSSAYEWFKERRLAAEGCNDSRYHTITEIFTEIRLQA